MENKLIPVEYKGQRILTTKQLAEVYETTEDNIKVNFNRNKDRFTKEKHYYLLTGEELKQFKNHVTDSYLVDKHASSLYLWTERGADRHCKILDTDKAWEQFDNLEEIYFKVKERSQLLMENEQLKEIVCEQRDLLNEFSKVTEEAKQQYKPSHKMKLDYSKMIRTLTNNEEEYQTVRDWCFGILNISKWEDTCINDRSKILKTISTVARLVTIKNIEQLSLF